MKNVGICYSLPLFEAFALPIIVRLSNANTHV